MTALLQLTARLLPFLFFILGPLMALAPRTLLAWIIVTTLAALPSFVQAFTAIRAQLCWRNSALLLGALAYSAASIFWSPSGRAFDMAAGLVGMGVCGAVLILGQTAWNDALKRQIIRAFAGGWLLGLALMLGEFFLDFPVYRWAENVPAGTLVNENIHKRAAALFGLSLWPVLFLLEGRARRAGVALAAFAFFLLCAFLTSRSLLLATLVGMAVLFFAWYHAALARWVLMLMIGFAIIFTPVLFSALPLLPKEITGRFFDSAQHRMKIWALTAEHVIEAPLFGNGIDASRGIESTVASEATSYMPEGSAVISLHPHNLFLQLWLDGGLAGALLWGGLLLLLADRTRYLPPAAQPYALAAGYASLTLLSTTYSILQAWWMAGHLAVAALILMIAYSRSSSAETSGPSAGGMA